MKDLEELLTRRELVTSLEEASLSRKFEQLLERKSFKMPRSSTSFYTSNVSLASLDRAKDIVKGSLKGLNIGGSMEHRMECEQPILASASSNTSVNREVSKPVSDL